MLLQPRSYQFYHVTDRPVVRPTLNLQRHLVPRCLGQRDLRQKRRSRCAVRPQDDLAASVGANDDRPDEGRHVEGNHVGRTGRRGVVGETAAEPDVHLGGAEGTRHVNDVPRTVVGWRQNANSLIQREVAYLSATMRKREGHSAKDAEFYPLFASQRL